MASPRTRFLPGVFWFCASLDEAGSGSSRDPNFTGRTKELARSRSRDGLAEAKALQFVPFGAPPSLAPTSNFRERVSVSGRAAYCKRQKFFYIRVMVSIEAKLNCEWHITDLKLRLAQLKTCSELGADASASAEFINLLQHNLDSWEDRKKTLVEQH